MKVFHFLRAAKNWSSLDLFLTYNSNLITGLCIRKDAGKHVGKCGSRREAGRGGGWWGGIDRLKNRLQGITRMNQGFLKSKFLFLKTFHGLSSSNYKAAQPKFLLGLRGKRENNKCNTENVASGISTGIPFLVRERGKAWRTKTGNRIGSWVAVKGEEQPDMWQTARAVLHLQKTAWGRNRLSPEFVNQSDSFVLVYFIYSFIHFCPHHTPCGILVPWPGNPGPWPWKLGVLSAM